MLASQPLEGQRMCFEGESIRLTLLVVCAGRQAESAPRSVGDTVGRNVLPGNVWGLCGASVPVQNFGNCGGLPIGLQLLAPDRAEADVLALAQAFEALRP